MTFFSLAIHHYKTSEEPTEPQSVEDILHEIRDLQECLQQKEKEELRRMLKQLKGMILQTQQLGETNESKQLIISLNNWYIVSERALNFLVTGHDAPKIKGPET